MPKSKSTLIFNLWQRNHYDELRKFLTVKLKSAEEAADITQEACVHVLSLRAPQDIRQPRAFLFKTALNLVVDALRRPHRRVLHLTDTTVLDSLPASTPTPESIVEARERLTLLQTAIAELPPKCRRVFLLHKFGNLTHKEIAARLGISRNMVEKHIIPDANRPFTVTAGVGTIQVLGTIFNVYKKTDQVVVTVLEGTVQITTDTGEGANGAKRESRIITRGQQLAYSETGHVMPVKPVQANVIAAWREGKMIFDETRLAEVLAEVSRYHTVNLRLADPKLNELKVSGIFQSENLDGLLHTITQILPVTVQQLSENLIVLSPGLLKGNSSAPTESSPHFRVKPRLSY